MSSKITKTKAEQCTDYLVQGKLQQLNQTEQKTQARDKGSLYESNT